MGGDGFAIFKEDEISCLFPRKEVAHQQRGEHLAHFTVAVDSRQATAEETFVSCNINLNT